MDVHMQSLSEYINDEDKLVTYKWLSKELKVHVNISKQILSEYWEKHKEDGISATFMLIGNTKDGGMRVEIVKDLNLTESLKNYHKLVSRHLYSLQKIMPDMKALTELGKADAEFGAIQCKESVILSDEDLFKKQWGSNMEYQRRYFDPNREKVQGNEVSISLPTIEEKSQVDDDKEKVLIKTEMEKGIPKMPVRSMMAGFGNLFEKVSSQKKSPLANYRNTSSNRIEKKVSEKNGGKSELAMVFGKTVDQEKLSAKSSEISLANKSNEKYSMVNKGSSSNFIDEETPMKIEAIPPMISISPQFNSGEDEQDIHGRRSQIVKKKSSSRNSKVVDNGKFSLKLDKKLDSDHEGKRERSQESSSKSKKRKRIIVHDSSDESGFSGNEEEPGIFDNFVYNEKPSKTQGRSTPVDQLICAKRKVRKMVDQTSIGEDGFMITKKVQAMESASEDDERIVSKGIQVGKKVERIKNTAPQKGKKINNKQTTLTSFFKKS